MSFLNFLQTNNFFGLMGLFGNCQLVESSSVPIAAIKVCKNPVITYNKELERCSNHTINFVLLHEITHLIQLADTSLKSAISDEEINYHNLNVAMDIAVHEKILKLFSKEQISLFFQETNEMFAKFYKTNEVKEGSSICLRENILPMSAPDQSYDYYYKHLNATKGKTTGSMDGHDLEELTPEQLEELRDVIQKSFDIGSIITNRAGLACGDAEFRPSKVTLDSQLKKLINQIRVKCESISVSNNRDYSYHKYNKILDTSDLPGLHKATKSVKKTAIVLDTSGSMWRPGTLNQLYQSIQELKKRHDVIPFCCDTELYEIDSVEVLKGGGGTCLTNEQIEKIVTHKHFAGIKGKIDVIYVTDGYLDLVPFKTNKKINSHLVIFNKE